MAQSNPQQPDISQYPNIAANQGKYLQPNQPAQIATDQVPDAPVQPQTMQVQGPANPNEGSYENLPQHVVTAVTQMVTKPVTAIAKGMRDFIGYAQDKPNGTQDAKQPLYDVSGNLTEYGKNVDNQKINDPLGRFIIGLDASNKAEDQQVYQNPLPHTVLGQGAQGIINVAPDIGTAALLPEAEGGEALSVFQKLKTAVWNPFTKVMIAKGGLEGYSSAEEKGATPGEAAKEAGKGAVIGGVNGATAGILGGIGGKLSESGMKTLIDAGLVKSNGAITKAALDAASDAAVFGAYPVATALAQGKKVDWDEVKSNLGMGLAFGGMKANETIGKDAELNNNIREVLNDRQAVAIQNFLNADPASIKAAYESKTSVGDTNAKAIEYAHQAQQEVDADKKNQYVLAASTLAKTSDVKGVTETILHDKDGFLAHIQQSDLPDNIKQQITDKVNMIHGQLDQYEQVKNQAAQDITVNQQQLEQMQPVVADPAIQSDPIRKTEAEVAIEKLQAKKEELFKKLKGAVSDQYDQHAENKIPVDNVPVQLPPSANVPEEEAGPPAESQSTPTETSAEKSVGKKVLPTDPNKVPIQEISKKFLGKNITYTGEDGQEAKADIVRVNKDNFELSDGNKVAFDSGKLSDKDLSSLNKIINSSKQPSAPLDEAENKSVDETANTLKSTTRSGKISEALQNKQISKENFDAEGYNKWTQVHNKLSGEDNPTVDESGFDGLNEVPKEVQAAVDAKAKELRNKNNTTNKQLKAQKMDMIDQMQEVHDALNGDNGNVDAVEKAGYEVDDQGRVVFNVKDDGVFKIHKDFLVDNDAINEVKKEFPEKVQNASASKTVSTPKRSTEKQLAENRPDLQATENRLQDAKDNLAEANRLKDEKMAKVWQAEVDREQKVYDIAKNIDYKPKTSENPIDYFKLGDQDEFYHASPTKRVGDLREGEAPQFGKGTYFSTNKDLVINEFGKELTKVNLSIKKPLYTGTKEEDEVGKLAAKNWNKDNLTYDKADEVWRDKKGKETQPVSETDLGEKLPVKYFSEAAKELGYDAIIDKNSHDYDNEIVVLDPKKIHYKEENKNAISEQKTGKVGVREPSAMGEGVGEQNESGKSAGEVAQPGKEVQSNGEEETAAIGRQPAGEHGLKATGEQLDVPALKDSPYKLAATELPNGKHGVFETESGKRISKLYDTREELLKNFEANKDKLTPEAIEAKINAENIKDGIKELPAEDVTFANDQLEPDGITLNDIKDYEQSIAERSEGNKPERTLPVDNAETVQKPETEPATGAAEDTGGKGVQESGVSKEQELKDKVADAKKRLSASLKKDRSTLKSGSPISAESLKVMAELVKTYTDYGLYKFRDMVKDWINTVGRDNFTEDEAAALKKAYLDHVSEVPFVDSDKYDNEAAINKFIGNQFVENPSDQVKEYDAEKISPQKAPSAWFSSVFGRNFSDLAAFEKERGTDQSALKSVYQAAGAEGTAKALLKITGQKILDAFKNKTEGAEVYDNLRKVLLQSNLNGIKQRWFDASEAAENLSEAEVKKWIKGESSSMPHLSTVMDALARHEQFAGLDRDYNTAVTNGDYEGVKSVLSNAFKKAGNSVHDLDWSDRSYDDTRNDPKVQRAKDIYVNEFDKPLAKAHAELGGTFRQYLGEENTYFPTNVLNEENGNIVRKWYMPKRSPIQKFITPHNDFATGLAERYDYSIKSLEDRVLGAVKANSFNRMINTLETSGYITKWTKGNAENMMNIDGTYYAAEKVNINKSSSDKKAVYYLIPKEISNELDTLMQSPPKEPSKLKQLASKIFGVINMSQLSTPLEATAHSANLLSRLNTNTPFAFTHDNKILDYAVGKGLGSLPIIKSIFQTVHMLGMDPHNEKWTNIAKEMADSGEVPVKYGSSTYSKAVAESTGADLKKWYKLEFSPLLYSTKGLDIRARMMMWSVMKDINPKATPLEIKKMMGTLGDYNPKTQSQVVHGLKEAQGMVPFIVSGHSRLYNAFKSFTGGNLPTESLSASKALPYKVANLVNASVYGYVATWAALHYLASGKPFWEDKDAQLGEVPLTPAMKQWMENNGLNGIINRNGKEYSYSVGGGFNSASLATKMVGLDAFYNNYQPFNHSAYDATAMEAGEKSFLQSFNTLASPLTSSPVVHTVSNMFGVAPYIITGRNKDGKSSPQLLTTSAAGHSGNQVMDNFINMGLNINPIVGASYNQAAKEFHLPKFGIEKRSNIGQVIWDQFLPKSMVKHVPISDRQYFLSKERAAANREADKEEDKEAGN